MSLRGTSTSFPTRATLLERLRAECEEDDWREFYALYWRPVYGYARRYGLSCEEAEDVVQDVMVAAVQALPAFDYQRSRGRFRGWMGTIARRKIIDRLRRRAVRVPEAASQDLAADWEEVADPRPNTPDERWDREWEQGLLSLATERTLAELEPHRREAFRRYVLEGEAAAAVAAACGLSVNAIYILKHRVIGCVRDEVERLQTEGWE